MINELFVFFAVSDFLILFGLGGLFWIKYQTYLYKKYLYKKYLYKKYLYKKYLYKKYLGVEVKWKAN